MKEFQTDTPKSKHESVRLDLGEMILLADELAHRNAQMRDEARRILDGILADLQSQCAADDTASRIHTESDRHAYRTVRRELQASWLRVDSLIDDMLSSATDEIFQFAAFAEARIRAYERTVSHRDART